MTRGVGEEAILLSHNVVATNAGATVMSRLETDIYHYLIANGQTSVDTDFAKGATESIDNETVQVVNPETGTQESTSVNVSAWLVERRGYYYHLASLAEIEGVELVTHHWVKMTPCAVIPGGNSFLSVIISDGTSPGASSTYVDDNGRVFFGESATSNSRFWVWQRSKGLSLILSDGNRIAISDNNLPEYEGNGTIYTSLDVDNNGRVFFGENQTNSGRFWTWDETTDGLSVITNSGSRAPGYNSTVATPTGRVFFGRGTSGSKPYYVSTSEKSTGLSLLTTNDGNIAYNSLSTDNSGRAFWGYGGVGSGKFQTWHESTGLSTILSNNYDEAGKLNTIVHKSTGRVFFGEYEASSPVSIGLGKVARVCRRYYLDNINPVYSILILTKQRVG